LRYQSGGLMRIAGNGFKIQSTYIILEMISGIIAGMKTIVPLFLSAGAIIPLVPPYDSNTMLHFIRHCSFV
jgi:hypothetical protein